MHISRSDSACWIGVDLDGTLAVDHGYESIFKIGEPVPAMVARVKVWLAKGIEVRVVTARVGPGNSLTTLSVARLVIRAWCFKHIGQQLPVTASKDFNMLELWDDRAVRVIANTGIRADAPLAMI